MTDWQPAEESYTQREAMFMVLALVFLCVEIYYMWTWCQWFTNCPKF